MTESDSDAHHRVLAAFVAEHRDQVDKHVHRDRKTAQLVEKIRGRAQAESRADGGEEQ